MFPLESWNQSSSSPVMTWVWTFLCNQEALRAYTQKSFRKPPLWGVSLGPFRTAFCDAVCRETVHTSYLFVGRPKRFNHPLIGQSAFVTLNVRRLHRVNPCEHVVNCCCVTFPFSCCHTKNPMEHAAPNEFGTQRMVTEVWSRREWHKPEVSEVLHIPKKIQPKGGKSPSRHGLQNAFIRYSVVGNEWMDWIGTIRWTESNPCTVYLKCLTQLFNLSQDLCGRKASIRLDWTCDCKFEPSKSIVWCVLPQPYCGFTPQCHELDSYTMTFFMSEKTCLSHSVLYRLDYVSVVRGFQTSRLCNPCRRPKNQGIQHQALRRQCLEVNFKRSKPFWPWLIHKA